MPSTEQWGVRKRKDASRGACVVRTSMHASSMTPPLDPSGSESATVWCISFREVQLDGTGSRGRMDRSGSEAIGGKKLVGWWESGNWVK
jgi:hypothetical protein